MTKFAAIVPAYQAEATLPACLAGLARAGFAPADILVVNDGSTDRTAEIAQSHGVGVIANDRPLRPARARNRGVDAVAADIVVFVDADVVLTTDMRRQLDAHFADPGLTAVIGSYDARVNAGVVSDYRNLLHHHVHHASAGPTQTFWTGIGAVRRAAFLEAGGLRSEWEDIEDVEFGLRLTEAGGRILLDPAIQGTHLKVWTPRSMFRTDLYGRAVPWSHLMLSGRVRQDSLNLSLDHRLAAAGVGLMLLGLGGALLWTGMLWLAGAGLIAFIAGSRDVIATLWRLRGGLFALGALPWHALHYVAGLAGYAKARLARATLR